VQQQIGALQLRHLEASKYWMNHSQLDLVVPVQRHPILHLHHPPPISKSAQAWIEHDV
jgi:hypothetical protein